MKNKLTRYAMLYIAEMMEEYNSTIDPMSIEEGFTDVNEFIQYFGIELKYDHMTMGNRRDELVKIRVADEDVAAFVMNVYM